MGLIIKPDFCRTIHAFVYLLHFRYIRMRIAHHVMHSSLKTCGTECIRGWAKNTCAHVNANLARLHEKDALLCSVGRLNLYPYPLKWQMEAYRMRIGYTFYQDSKPPLDRDCNRN